MQVNRAVPAWVWALLPVVIGCLLVSCSATAKGDPGMPSPTGAGPGEDQEDVPTDLQHFIEVARREAAEKGIRLIPLFARPNGLLLIVGEGTEVDLRLRESPGKVQTVVLKGLWIPLRRVAEIALRENDLLMNLSTTPIPHHHPTDGRRSLPRGGAHPVSLIVCRTPPLSCHDESCQPHHEEYQRRAGDCIGRPAARIP